VTFRRQISNAGLAVAVYALLRVLAASLWTHPVGIQGWYGANLESIVLGAPFSFVVAMSAQLLAKSPAGRLAVALTVGAAFAVLFWVV
jgi:hypothetical protein